MDRRPYGRRRDGGLIEKRSCEVCGELFWPQDHKDRRQLTCSRSCGRKRYFSLIPAEVREARREAYRQAELERWRKKNRVRRGPDVVCEPYTLAEIAARDGHRCGLCRRKVNMALKSPHPRSPSIDHIIPLSISRDDTRANVQLAHRRCNVAKGVRAVGEQLALIG